MANRNRPFGIGSLSIIMVFVSLILIVFATLALLTVDQNYKLTQKTLQSFQDYYEAEGKAQAILAQIDELIVRTSDSNALEEELEALEGVEHIEKEEEMIIGYEIPYGRNQILRVKIKIDSPYQPIEQAKKNGANLKKRYQITEWVSLTSESALWESEEPMFSNIVVGGNEYGD